MNKKLFFLFIISASLVLFMSNRNGRATSQGLGSTGAPGDDQTVCQSCHNGPIDVKVEILVLDQFDTIKIYEPNKDYTVRVSVSHVGGNVPKAYGFQIVALKAPLRVNGKDIQNWISIPSNTVLAIAKNGRQYVEHKDRSISNVFEMTWRAPDLGSGPVSFYAGGNGVNSDNSTNGDGAARTSLQIDEQVLASVKDLNPSNLRIFPNPVYDEFSLQGDLSLVSNIRIYDLLGKVVFEDSWCKEKNSLNIGFLKEGIYLAQLKSESGKALKTIKLVKKNFKP